MLVRGAFNKQWPGSGVSIRKGFRSSFGNALYIPFYEVGPAMGTEKRLAASRNTDQLYRRSAELGKVPNAHCKRPRRARWLYRVAVQRRETEFVSVGGLVPDPIGGWFEGECAFDHLGEIVGAGVAIYEQGRRDEFLEVGSQLAWLKRGLAAGVVPVVKAASRGAGWGLVHHNEAHWFGNPAFLLAA